MDDLVMGEHDLPRTSTGADYLDSICSAIDRISEDVRAISLSIHDLPELQYKEYHAHHILTEYIRQRDGWQVMPSAYDIDTAFVAVYDSGREGATVSFNAEYSNTSA